MQDAPDFETPAPPSNAAPTWLVRYAWGTLLYNLVVIVWGAVVRATGAGAGCGSHWPMCNGDVIPAFQSVATQIEFSHRVTSGLSLVAVLGLVVLTFRALPKGHVARSGAVVSLVLSLGEGAIGAIVVLYKRVAKDGSGWRAVSSGLHLGNTFLLVAALAVTCMWISGMPRPRWKQQSAATWLLALTPLVMLLFVGASGAIAALGDTLFPAQTLRDGLVQDQSATAHLFVRLRVYHPFFATAAVAAILFFPPMLAKRRPSRLVTRAATTSRYVALAQWGVGLANVALLAPIAVQLVHLILADLLWLALVMLALGSITDTDASLSAEVDPRLRPLPPPPPAPRDLPA